MVPQAVLREIAEREIIILERVVQVEVLEILEETQRQVRELVFQIRAARLEIIPAEQIQDVPEAAM